jgi:hypothetical protein
MTEEVLGSTMLVIPTQKGSLTVKLTEQTDVTRRDQDR